ncbi:MAG TPA: hypothetical protein PLD88_10050, partial [Candidatus Berkiella sp.]|nr:hypothetical protein [Candidatus Berkiella sp.]
KSRKLCIEQGLYREYTALFAIANTIIDVTAEAESNNHNFSQQLSNAKQQNEALAGLLKNISDLDNAHSLPFEWKTPPTVARRIHLDNFTDEEKAIFAINDKSNEITDGLNDISNMLEKRLKSKKLSNHARSDLLHLTVIVEQSKKELKDSNETLFMNLQKKELHSKQHAYIKKQEDLDKIVKDLGQKISRFEPKNPKTTNVAKKFIQNIVNLFKKSNSLTHDPQKVLAKKIDKLEQSQSSQRRKEMMSFLYNETTPEQVSAPSKSIQTPPTVGSHRKPKPS